MSQCDTKGCEKEGVHQRDFTCGPLGDYRCFCDDHIKDVDEQQKRDFILRQVIFQKSVVQNSFKKLEIEVDDLLGKIDNLQKLNVSERTDNGN